ncbi:PhnD/SsuA/transferrin family substrate-binding protein [Aminobacter anthyllidis]|uniref:PhnD/SsuA/transferrin family substrate-binding protein n=1 Tax=Aminobacter anthyllidis TaxID=1035067 RepID=A0A9X1AGY1_9HYPH|nr:PhnD/SsuA/transferrin family substrate-binding protein [Aminobacter anthyllidis]MBT1159657.1 PhnD/SsuA/transferrin family substrate-binding protein [Aminobacter anthyllidis]
MYNFAEMKEANVRLLSSLQERMRAREFDVSDIIYRPDSPPIPETTGQSVYFTQVCGFPLMKCFRDQYRLLAAPIYSFEGCIGATHRAFFLVRSESSAVTLADMSGATFGCNSLLSNSGMNLPRLSLAQLKDRRPQFSAIKITGNHSASLDELAAGNIDLCSIDCVTWGLFQSFRPDAARRFRILEETSLSPTIPFVTSAETSDAEAASLVEVLHDVMNDPALQETRNILGLLGLEPPDMVAYKMISELEVEATRLGYANIV